MTDALLQIDDLHVTLPADGQQRTVIHDVELRIGAGEAVGVVGESGAGKSMMARSIVGLLPAGATVAGNIRFEGQDVRTMTSPARREFFGTGVGMVFQDPRAHINPIRTIGDFMIEALVTNGGVAANAARARAARALDDVGIVDPERRLEQYPHELSGGMLQRVMIASALLPEPRFLIADEPTTALDVTTQSDVMAIIEEQTRERGMGLLFITHNLDLAAAVCDRTVVMYAGRVVEDQRSERLYGRPLHPYSAGLAAARPALDRVHRLAVIPGRSVSAFEAPGGCPFAPRCAFAQDRCRETDPVLRVIDDEGVTACCRIEEIQDILEPSVRADA